MTQPPSHQPSLRQVFGRGIFWSALQSWGNRAFTFILVVLLARLLSPEDFGIASAAMLVLMLVPLIAELGFGDSIMQRRDLKPSDVNLPFLLASGIAVVLVTLIVLLREPIAAWVGLEGQTLYLMAISATVLISVPTAFQEAMYKRNLQFRALALRAFAANIAGGLAALGVALAGFGIWTFVVQAWVTLIVNVVWIWSRPQWWPSWQTDWLALRQMLRFGIPVVAQRLVDFAGTRTLDIVIISQIGLAAYGLYVVGSRVYLTMMQLLQSTFYDVSLTVLSKVAHDRERIAGVYLQTVAIAARVMLPIFVMTAALAPEICTVLFGTKWAGVEAVAQPLLLMGAVHCVQYMNGAFLSARGRPELILVTGVAKSLLQIAALIGIGGQSVTDLTLVYVSATLLVSPLSFFMVGRELGLGLSRIARSMALPALISAMSFAAVTASRPYLIDATFGSLFKGLVLFIIFVVIHLLLSVVFDRRSFTALSGQLARFRK